MLTLDEIYTRLQLPWAARTLSRRLAQKGEARAQAVLTRAKPLGDTAKEGRADAFARQDIDKARQQITQADKAWMKEVRALLGAQGRAEFISGSCCLIHYGRHSGTVVFGVIPEVGLTVRATQSLARMKAQAVYAQGRAEARALTAKLKAQRDELAKAKRDLAQELIVFQQIQEELDNASKGGADYRTKYDIRNKQNACRARVKTRQRRVDKLDVVLQNV